MLLQSECTRTYKNSIKLHEAIARNAVPILFSTNCQPSPITTNRQHQYRPPAASHQPPPNCKPSILSSSCSLSSPRDSHPLPVSCSPCPSIAVKCSRPWNVFWIWVCSSPPERVPPDTPDTTPTPTPTPGLRPFLKRPLLFPHARESPHVRQPARYPTHPVQRTTSREQGQFRPTPCCHHHG